MSEETAAYDAGVPAIANPDLPAVGAPRGIALAIVLDEMTSLDVIQKRHDHIAAFFERFMEEDIDVGKIPGTQKRTLLGSGADKLEGLFQVTPRLTMTERIEQWEAPLFQYEWRCELLSLRTGEVVATGVGSANSMESRYRWRDGKRVCPDCNKPTIIKGNPKFNNGVAEWVCWTREKTGCGAKFRVDDPKITAQQIGRVPNDDLHSQVNTILKIGKKRAKVDAMVNLLRAAGYHVEPDDEDDDKADGAANGGDHTGGGKGKGAATTGDTVTEAERKKFADAYTKAGHKWSDVVAWAKATHGIDLSKQGIPKPKFDEMLGRVSQKDPLVAGEAATTGTDGKLI